jgi:hypothetical protein
MSKRWNSKNNDIGIGDDLFCFVGNLDGVSILVFHTFFREGFSEAISFSWEGGDDGNITVRL